LQKVHLEANIPMFKVFLVGTTLLPQAWIPNLQPPPLL
jgi:hypothetical protein